MCVCDSERNITGSLNAVHTGTGRGSSQSRGAIPRGQKKIFPSLLIPRLENNSSVLSNIPDKGECIQSLMLSEIPISSGPREEHRPCGPRSSHCGLYIRRCDWLESKKLVANCCQDMQGGSSSSTVSTSPKRCQLKDASLAPAVGWVGSEGGRENAKEADFRRSPPAGWSLK